MMDAADRNFLFMCAYFWREKGDLERYVDFDAARLAKLDPLLHQMWVRYLDARAALDIVSDTVAQANDPDRPEAS